VTDADIDRQDRKGRRAPVFFAGFASFAAFAFFLLHFPYLPQSLEDLDSINFALGVRQFDVAQHQPHPPGYPVFIVLAKTVRTVVPSELTALALVSVLTGSLGVAAIAWLFRRLADDGGWQAWLPPTLIAMTAPLYWFTAVRPLSDMAGLAAAIGVQALTISARTPTLLVVAAFSAGVASGLRSQVAWLTVPLLVVAALRVPDSRLERADLDQRPSPSRVGLLASSVAAFAAGALLWLVPLVVVSGGRAAYWRALSNQGAEDLGNISMLWTRHDVGTIVEAFYFALIAPWATWAVAIIVLGCGAVGIGRLWRSNLNALIMLTAAFGPYFVFDLLFQETYTGRYALPLVVPMAYLAAAGIARLPTTIAVIAAVALAMFDAHVGGTSIAAYARQKAPAFRLLDDMAAEPARGSSPVLAMDRRNAFDFRRPIVWAGAQMPRFETTLAAPPQHEWLEAMRYWNRGGRGPLWLVVDPKRTAIDLLQHHGPARYRWALPYPALVSGARPDEMDWYRVEHPEWYVGEGWALTPEAAGVAAADQRGPAFGPIHAGVARSVISARGPIMIGGRSFDPAARPRLTASVDGTVILDKTLAPGGFLEFTASPIIAFADAPDGYAALTIATTPPAPVAIEQFDASSSRTLAGFGAGWQEQEFNPVTGLRWRWLSERGELHLRQVAQRPVTLHLEGESPRKYFSRGSRLVIRSGDRAVFDRVLDDDFSVDVPLGAPSGPVVLETDQVYTPADRSRRTRDQRHLGLRIFTCELLE